MSCKSKAVLSVYSILNFKRIFPNNLQSLLLCVLIVANSIRLKNLLTGKKKTLLSNLISWSRNHVWSFANLIAVPQLSLSHIDTKSNSACKLVDVTNSVNWDKPPSLMQSDTENLNCFSLHILYLLPGLLSRHSDRARWCSQAYCLT